MNLCWSLLLLLLAACSHSQQRDDLYPPLWRIHSTAHSNTVWLFGAVHTMPRGKSSRLQKIQRVLSGVSPRLLRPPWVSNAIYNALVTSEKLVIELDLNRELRNDNASLFAYINDELQAMPVTAENLPPLHAYDLDQATQQALRSEAASISRRNMLWLDEIVRLADSGERVFIAVGEAHLYGPDNLRNLLVQRGYRIERIQ